MKTEALIDFLAARTTPIEANVVARRFAVALGWSAFCTTLLMALVLGVRADLVSVLHLPMFWIKLALPLVVALASARRSRVSRDRVDASRGRRSSALHRSRRSGASRSPCWSWRPPRPASRS